MFPSFEIGMGRPRTMDESGSMSSENAKSDASNSIWWPVVSGVRMTSSASSFLSS